jgi:hypothetical protein
MSGQWSRRGVAVFGITLGLAAQAVQAGPWEALGGVITFSPAVAQNADGRLEVFARWNDGEVRHRSQLAPNSKEWSPWASLGGGLLRFGGLNSGPAVAQSADGRLQLFVRGNDNALWYRRQTAASGGAWTEWASLEGNLEGDVAVGRNEDGRLEAFARNRVGFVSRCRQLAVNESRWSSWESMGGVLNLNPVIGPAPGLAQNADGRIEVFMWAENGTLWENRQLRPGGTWSGWEPLGGSLSSPPAPGLNADGRLIVFVRGAGGVLYARYQRQPGTRPWADWVSLGGTLTSYPAVGRNLDGRLEVFARGADNALWHRRQLAPAGGWLEWASLGGTLSGPPVVSQNGDGRLSVFVPGPAGALWHRAQNTPGAW